MAEIKNLLFDSLLEPLDPSNRNSNFNYDTFRYGPEREKRWVEMEDYFKKMLGQIITDVSSASVRRKQRSQATSSVLSASKTIQSEVTEEVDEDEYDEEDEEEEEEEE